jgi:hypothetical protein
VFTWFCLEIRTIRSCEASGKSWTENKSVILSLSASPVQNSLRSSLLFTLDASLSVIVQVCHLGDELELRIAEERVRWWRFFNESLRTASNSSPLIEIRVCVLRCSWVFGGFDRNRIEREREILFLRVWCVGKLWMVILTHCSECSFYREPCGLCGQWKLATCSGLVTNSNWTENLLKDLCAISGLWGTNLQNC